MRIRDRALVAIAGLGAALVVLPATTVTASTPAVTVAPTSYQATLPWPHTNGQRSTKTFVYTNHTRRALTLKLAIGAAYQGGPSGSGVWSLSRTRLRIAAHNHPSVSLTAYGAGPAVGDYKNLLLAAYGTTRLSTAIEATIAPQPSFKLTVNVIDRTGARVTPKLTLHRNASSTGYGGCAGRGSCLRGAGRPGWCSGACGAGR